MLSLAVLGTGKEGLEPAQMRQPNIRAKQCPRRDVCYIGKPQSWKDLDPVHLFIFCQV